MTKDNRKTLSPDQLSAIYSRNEAAFNAASEHTQQQRRTEIDAIGFAAQFAGFDPDPEYEKQLAEHAVLANQELASFDSEDAQETINILRDVSQGTHAGSCVIFGQITATNGFTGRIDLTGKKGVISSAQVGLTGAYRLTTECADGQAVLEIFDQTGARVLRDGQPIDMAQVKVMERNFTISACGEMEVETIEEPDLSMPDLIGKKLKEGSAILNKLGEFDLQTVNTTSDENPNTITAQTPEQGTPLSQGQVISLTIAQPREQIVTMPDMTGMNHDEAEKILKELPFASISYDQVTDPQMVDKIVKQSPAPGTPLSKETEILLCFGNDALLMPDVNGHPLTKAKEKLIPAYVQDVQVVYRESEGKADIVIHQLPAYAQPVTADTVVRLTVSKPIKPITEEPAIKMPDLRGMTLTDARRHIKRSGIRKVEFDTATAKKRGYRVNKQWPNPGAELKPNETPTLKFGPKDG